MSVIVNCIAGLNQCTNWGKESSSHSISFGLKFQLEFICILSVTRSEIYVLKFSRDFRVTITDSDGVDCVNDKVDWKI